MFTNSMTTYSTSTTMSTSTITTSMSQTPSTSPENSERWSPTSTNVLNEIMSFFTSLPLPATVSTPSPSLATTSMFQTPTCSTENTECVSTTTSTNVLNEILPCTTHPPTVSAVPSFPATVSTPSPSLATTSMSQTPTFPATISTPSPSALATSFDDPFDVSEVVTQVDSDRTIFGDFLDDILHYSPPPSRSPNPSLTSEFLLRPDGVPGVATEIDSEVLKFILDHLLDKCKKLALLYADLDFKVDKTLDKLRNSFDESMDNKFDKKT